MGTKQTDWNTDTEKEADKGAAVHPLRLSYAIPTCARGLKGSGWSDSPRRKAYKVNPSVVPATGS